MNCPYFLVAMPQISDQNFARKVLLLVEHDHEGALAFVINQPLVDLNDQVDQVKIELKNFDGNTLVDLQENIFWGGPVKDDTLYALHCLDHLACKESKVSQGLYFSHNLNLFQKLMEENAPSDKRRFFLGSVGWSAGQLDAEIRTGSWLMVPYDHNFLFGSLKDQHPDTLWSDQLWRKIALAGGCNPYTLMSPGGQHGYDLVN